MIKLELDTSGRECGAWSSKESRAFVIRGCGLPYALAHEMAHIELHWKTGSVYDRFFPHANQLIAVRHEIEAWKQAATWCKESGFIAKTRECLATYIDHLTPSQVKRLIRELEREEHNVQLEEGSTRAGSKAGGKDREATPTLEATAQRQGAADGEDGR